LVGTAGPVEGRWTMATKKREYDHYRVTIEYRLHGLSTPAVEKRSMRYLLLRSDVAMREFRIIDIIPIED
jgi:hypothetical protein